MSSTYIDCNIQNSVNVDSTTNNRWTYQLGSGMRVPTGSKITVQNSFINLKGITGASIEIREDIVEEIVLGYYSVDTTYPELITTPNPLPETNGNYGLFYDGIIRSGLNKVFQDSPQKIISNDQCGWSEVPMPLCGLMKIENSPDNPAKTPPENYGIQFLIPFTSKITLNIPKGIYSVSSLSNLMSDQINGRVDPSNPYQSQIERLKKQNQYTGALNNNTTNRMGYVHFKGYWETYAAEPNRYKTIPIELKPQGDAAEISDFVLNPSLEMPRVGAMVPSDTNVPSCIAVTPQKLAEVKKFWKENDPEDIKPTVLDGSFENWGVTSSILQIDGNLIPDSEIPAAYCLAYESQFLTINEKLVSRVSTSNIGLSFGTTGFQFQYNPTNSGFSISGCHEPRAEGTIDRWGNSVKASGQVSAYLKRVSPWINNLWTGNPGFTQPSTQETETLLSVLNSVMSRLSGIYIYNWSYGTAKKFRTNNNTLGDDFKEFDEFFTLDIEAQEAWKQTIWYRLGFSYDDLQNRNNWEQNPFYINSLIDGEPDLMNLGGFTTNSDLDSSAIPEVSTLYNSLEAAPVKAGKNDSVFALSAVARGSARLYNLTDVCSPSIPFNNNTSNGNISVTAYQNSLYQNATMFPVAVASKEVVASNLPTLSIDGYFLITSDIIAGNDFVSHNDQMSIIDVVPISSLSNQDFISDRNDLVHTVTNDIVLNNINIAILRPDLTNPVLNPNSSVMLKIEFPSVPNTVLIAGATEEAEENQTIKEAQVEQAADEAAVSGKKIKKKKISK